MEDEKIIDLLWRRCEAAIEQLDRKYGGYCFSIANRILNNRQDAEECVSDTYLAAWNRIPPTRPNNLAAFLGRITRNLSISRWRSRSAISRGGGEMDLALEELAGCVAGPWDVTRELEKKELERAIVFFQWPATPSSTLFYVPFVLIVCFAQKRLCLFRVSW